MKLTQAEFTEWFVNTAINYSNDYDFYELGFDEDSDIETILETLNTRENYIVRWEILQELVNDNCSFEIVQESEQDEIFFAIEISTYTMIEDAGKKYFTRIILDSDATFDFSDIETLYEEIQERDKEAEKLLEKLI